MVETRGAALLIARACQRTVLVFEAVVAMMGSRFVGTAAKFEEAVVHCVRDMGADEAATSDSPAGTKPAAETESSAQVDGACDSADEDKEEFFDAEDFSKAGETTPTTAVTPSSEAYLREDAPELETPRTNDRAWALASDQSELARVPPPEVFTAAVII
ncbi:hypothetical protein HPB47_010363 [Ixodes persulcatus]|uniref:Uncharacterized protein n=1 Tax=Ixodes persulcatus TaxID=34615 RepID=A0AC60NZA7_IXOPE|nr:hypothetical protein HPB47_010363 [Ixodes persulcatus]